MITKVAKVLNLLSKILKKRWLRTTRSGFQFAADGYARAILFAGSSLLTVALFSTTALLVLRNFDSYLSSQAELLDDQINAVNVSLAHIASQADYSIGLYETLLNVELGSNLRRFGPSDRKRHSDYLRQFDIAERDCPLVVYHSPSRRGRGKHDHLPCSSRLLRNFWFWVMDAPDPLSHPNYVSYIFGANGNYLAELGKVIRSNPKDIDAYIADRIHPIFESLRANPPKRHNHQKGWWLPLHYDRALQQQALSYVLPVVHQGKVIAIYALSIPRSTIYSRVLKHKRLHHYCLVNGTDVLAYPPEETRQCEAHALAIARNRGDHAHTSNGGWIRIGSTFYLLKEAIDRKWIWVYTIDPALSVKGQLLDALVVISGLVAILTLLWMMTFWFDSRVLMPIAIQIREGRENEQFTRAMVDLLPFGVSVHDRKFGAVVMMNGAARAYACEHAKLFLLLHSRLPNNDSVEVTPLRIEHEITAGGESIHLEVMGLGTRYMGRDVVLCTTHDQTARVRSEQYLLAAKQAADEASRAKSAFLAAMSHQIRTPLHGALGNLELLGNRRLSADQRELVDVIQRSFGSLLARVDNVLDQSKLEANQWRVTTSMLNLGELVEQCIQALLPLIRRPGVRIDYRIGAGLDSICGDATILRQVLMNLLHNAGKFTHRGAIVVTARLCEGATSKHDVEIIVADSGTGIPPEQMQRLFEPFTQLTHAGADLHTIGVYGSGLGLALCKSFCDLMGGSIHVHSTLGEGSRFSFRVPYAGGNESSRHDNARLRGTTCLVCVERADWPNDLPRWLLGEGAQLSRCSSQEVSEASTDHVVILVVGMQAPARQRLAKIARSARGIVVVADDGPLRPVRRGCAWFVSSYSKVACIDAVLLAAGGNVEDEGAATAAHFWTTSPPPNALRMSRRILVVDDDEISRQLIAQQLRQLGVACVDESADGDDAFDRTLSHKYDLIFTDLRMSRVNGDTFVRILREANIATPVVLVTANIEWRNVADDDHTGFAAILVKPVTLADIGRVLEENMSGIVRLLSDPHPRLDYSRDPKLEEIVIELVSADLALGRAATANHDAELLARVTHKIAGALLMVGEEGLGARARALEKACAGGYDKKLEGQFEALDRCVDEWLDGLRTGEKGMPHAWTIEYAI
ncbi:ATP-binding protein (plasmid) [Burkholderia sp. FERM BP-3421]|uniref:hybrid sensor histidine kinase/response regulator n=1 Tax=Burkholderia sp. FERM BP-3421 TaxID=1494466 RepID=UPI00235F7585|nr:hybrid sensor histidine kinase/response regulator [Burkholderia sp. FERM BP-3421]WDD90525.1 ATP-binding protein [Burkholderia sp. FERM BP-3421]